MELRRFTVGHLDHVADLIADPEILRHTRIPEPPGDDFAPEWLARYEQGRIDGTREAFAIHGDDGGFLGLALAPVIDREGREAELGYMVASHARGRGVATEALGMLTTWAFEELGAQRVALLIDVLNHASLRVAERCGYVREGLLRSVHHKQGIRIDVTVWSRLPSDPAPNTRSS
jgi:RimJ/RimL family protein N-acetyltransferase